MLLSLFCGAGGLDSGFEQAGFEVGLAFDRNPDSIESYNRNRAEPKHAFVEDVTRLSPQACDQRFGKRFSPSGIIGGPPCQSFSQANVNQYDDDPRHLMPVVYANLAANFNAREPLDFVVMENVVGLTSTRHRKTLSNTISILEEAGFCTEQHILNAQDYGTPQSRKRLFVVGFNRQKFGELKWQRPDPLLGPPLTVRHAIEGLPPAVHFQRNLVRESFVHHPNHWCMTPKSPKFKKSGALREGDVASRSFKTLAWDRPSIAVAYGHREVHIHPDGTRRLSVYEAMLLQGFPQNYELIGTLSSQITQVSEAVPPPLAEAVARSLVAQMKASPMRPLLSKKIAKVVNIHRSKRQAA